MKLAFINKNIKRNLLLVSFFCFNFLFNVSADDSLASSIKLSPLPAASQVTTSQTVSTITAPIFSRTNEIYGIFQILQQLEFEQVPEASLTAPIAEAKPNNRLSPKNLSNLVNRNENTDSRNLNDLQIVSELKNENINLQRTNTQLKNDLERFRTNGLNTIGITQVLNNVVERFSQERISQDSLLKDKLNSRISTLENTLLEQKNRLNIETSEENRVISKELSVHVERLKIDNEKLKNENQVLQSKIEEILALSDARLLEREQKIKDLERRIADFRTIESNNIQNSVKEEKSLTSVNETLLSQQLADMNRELVATRKALSEEQLKGKRLNNHLADLSNQLNAQAQQQQSVATQNQSKELISLRQRVQQAEIINQKFQQELLLAETNLNQKQAIIDSLNSENSQIAQQFSQQINALNQSLANARRAEAEANRWARSAGGGNPSVSAARLASLQQELESLRSTDEKQRFEAITKQQEMIVLQSQLSKLQVRLNAEEQSKKLLEDQIIKLNESNSKKIIEPVANQNNTVIKDSAEVKAPLSTSAGLQGIAR